MNDFYIFVKCIKLIIFSHNIKRLVVVNLSRLIISLLVWSVRYGYSLLTSVLKVRCQRKVTISNKSTMPCTHKSSHSSSNTGCNPLTHKSSLAIALGNTDKSATFNTLHIHSIIAKLEVGTAFAAKGCNSLATVHCCSRTFDDNTTSALKESSTSASKKAWLKCSHTMHGLRLHHLHWLRLNHLHWLRGHLHWLRYHRHWLRLNHLHWRRGHLHWRRGHMHWRRGHVHWLRGHLHWWRGHL